MLQLVSLLPAAIIYCLWPLCLCALATSASAQQESATDEHWRSLASDAQHVAVPSGGGDLPTNGTFFAGTLTDHAVLQKGAAASAAVYGVSFGATSATKVTITVAEEGQAAYTVAAELMPTGHAGNVTWKALLHPHKP